MHQTWIQSFDTEMLQDWMKQQVLKAEKRIPEGKQVARTTHTSICVNTCDADGVFSSYSFIARVEVRRVTRMIWRQPETA